MSDKTLAPRSNGSQLAHTGPRLRDLIYLDFEKCASIFSQLEGGLLREMQSTSETAGDARVTGELNIGIAKLGSGLGTNDKRQELESRVLHHDVLDRIESNLAEQQLLLDLNGKFPDGTPDEATVREAIEGHSFYVRAEGWVMVEDYRRMTRIASSFNSLMEFLVKCATDTVKKSPEYQQLSAQLRQMKENAKAQASRDQRAMEVERVKAIERQLASLIEAAASGGGIED